MVDWGVEANVVVALEPLMLLNWLHWSIQLCHCHCLIDYLEEATESLDSLRALLTLRLMVRSPDLNSLISTNWLLHCPNHSKVLLRVAAS